MISYRTRALLACLTLTVAGGSASAAVLIDGVSPSPTDPLTTATPLTSITVGSNVFSQLVTPTQVSVSDDEPGDIPVVIRGSADDPGFPTAAQTLLDNDLTTGHGDAAGEVVTVLFGSTIVDNDDLPDVFGLDWGNTKDTWTNIRAIIGGTLENPVFGGSAVASIETLTRLTSANGRFISVDATSGSTGILQDIGGFGLDLSDDLGVSSIIGLQFEIDDVDPVGVYAVIPEPATLGMVVAAGVVVIARRRHA